MMNKLFNALLFLAFIFFSMSIELSPLIDLNVGTKKSFSSEEEPLSSIEKQIVQKTNSEKYSENSQKTTKNDQSFYLNSEENKIEKNSPIKINSPFKLQNGQSNSNWFNLDWKYRKNITILNSKISQSQDNFPFLLDIYDSDLKYALNTGFDILFTDANNTQLSHEIEIFDKFFNQTHSHLMTWVKTNLSDRDDTILMMYFGNPFSSNQENPSGVWSNGYEAVWHLNEDPSGSIVDSTGTYNGTALGGMTLGNLQGGMISNGLYFDGLNDRILVGDINSDNWNQITIESWISVESLNNLGIVITKENAGGGNEVWTLLTDFKRFKSKLTTDGVGGNYYYVQSGIVINSANQWYHTSWTWDGDIEDFYFDGVWQGSYSSAAGETIIDSSVAVSIGAEVTGTIGQYVGLLDEIRVSSVARSAGWFELQNNNQRNPRSFYLLNSLETLQLEQNWAINALNYRKNITILSSMVDQNENGFPFVLELYDQDLHDKTQFNGEDILFTDVNGNRLEFEVEKYSKDYNLSYAKLTSWIKIPQLSNLTDTILTMYYGNNSVKRYDYSNNVWDNFRGVWHLSENVVGGQTNGNHIDSTKNNYDGSQTGNDNVIGKIAEGQLFDGVNDKIIVSQGPNLNSKVVISGWFKLSSPFSSLSLNTSLLISKFQDQNNNIHLALAGSDYSKVLDGTIQPGALVFKVEDNNFNLYKWTNKVNWLANAWYYFVLVHEPNDPELNQIIINSIDETNLTYFSSCVNCNIILDFPGQWSFGGGTTDIQIPGGQGWFNGTLDEIRIRTLVSQNQIDLEYTNQFNPYSFYTSGQEQFGDFDPPIVNSFGAEDIGTGQIVYWADIIDIKGSVSSTQIEINGSIFDMSFNGTFWTYQQNVFYNNNYIYKVVNTTDSQGNFLLPEFGEKNISANMDIINPEITNILYDSLMGQYGTFRVNASDPWGLINSVTVQILTCATSCSSTPVAMQKSGIEYINDSLILPRGSITFIIAVTDNGGNFISSPIQSATVINKPPSVFNINFTSNSPTSNGTLGISYNYSDFDGDSDTGSEIRWYENNILQTQYNDLLSIPMGTLTKGKEWYVTVRPKDGINFGLLNHTYINATVINSAPTSSNLNLPTNPKTTNDLIASWNYFDVDNDVQSGAWQIKWYLNGAYQSVYDNQNILPSSATTKNQNWYFTLKIYDGFEYSILYTSPTVVILNSAPEVQYAKINSGGFTALDTDNLNVNYTYNDADGDLEETSFQTLPIIYWYVQYSGQPTASYNSTFANWTQIPSSWTKADEIWYYIIRVSDGSELSPNKTSGGVSIGVLANNGPSVSNLQILGNNSINCVTESCTTNYNLYASYTYTDPEGNSESGTEVRWYRNGLLVPEFNGTMIISLTSTTKNDTWYFTVTPYDVLGAVGSINTSTSITIKNSLPVINSVSLSPSSAYTFSTLESSYLFSDIDGDSEFDRIIKWYMNGTEITALENNTQVSSSYLTKWDKWNFSISIFDGNNWSIFKVSPIIIILNSEPMANNILLSGGGTTLDNITLVYDFTDLDGDQDFSSYEWYIFNPRIPQLSTIVSSEKTLNYVEYEAGFLIWVIITPNDGEVNGEDISTINIYSGVIVVGNSNPQISGDQKIVTENNTQTFFASSDLFVKYNASDLDGTIDNNTQYDIDYDSQNQVVVNAEYRWYKFLGNNWIIQHDLANNFVPKTMLSKGDIWKASVRIADQQGLFSQWFNTSQIEIQNTAPEIQMTNWKNPTPSSSEDIRILYQFYDIDNDLERQSLIRWFKNGVEITDNENQTELSRIYFLKDDIIYVLITPFDGDNYGSTFNSSDYSGLLIILNTKPIVSGIVINSGQSTFTNNSLNVTWNYSDFDQDSEIVPQAIIEWYRNGQLLSGLTNLTQIDSGNTTKNERWEVRIRVFDGIEYSEQKTSTSLFIQNSVMSLLNVRINSNESVIFSNGILVANYNPIDLDSDLLRDYQIYWYKNGLLVNISNKTTSILAINLTKGDYWYFVISVTDDNQNWSGNYMSQIIYVINSLPIIQSLSFDNPNPTSQDNITVIYTFFDLDGDNQNMSLIQWFINGTESAINQNKTTLNSSYITKGSIIFVLITPFDGEAFGITYNSSDFVGVILIDNSRPEAREISINHNQITYTNESLIAYWTYFDIDNDPEIVSQNIIEWYRDGQLLSGLTNLTQIDSGNTTKNDRWEVRIQVFDSKNYSFVNISSILIIANAPMALKNVEINSNDPTSYSSGNLTANFVSNDLDILDFIQDYQIYWYQNGIYRNDLTGKIKTISANELIKGDNWYFFVNASDGVDWSVTYKSQEILIINSVPSVENVTFVFPQTNITPANNLRGFYLEDEIINLNYNFSDADSLDNDSSIILWFKNGTIQGALNNSHYVDNVFTSPGDIWYAIIIPSDSYNNGTQIKTLSIFIESRPKIYDSGYHSQTTTPLIEGQYDLWILANDTRRGIKRVEFYFNDNLNEDQAIKELINSLSSPTVPITKTNGTLNTYEAQFDILKLLDTPYNYHNYIGKKIIVEIIVYTNISNYDVFTSVILELNIQDDAPPRVTSFGYDWDPNNPTYINFTAVIEEFGSDIENVTLFYSVNPKNYENLRIKYIQSDFDNWILMNPLNLTHYSVKIDYEITEDLEINYEIVVFDSTGHGSTLSTNRGAENLTITYQPPGLAVELVAGVILLILVVAVLFTFVGIRKFRKTDIVGLDIDKVVEETKNISSSDITQNLSVHTLGIVVSTFHQSLGPTPIFVNPSILTDNIDKLIDLSDRSFGAVRFVEDFVTEMQTNFDYSLSSSIRITSMSYGFSLNRPDSRGGQENITLNILLHKPYDVILTQFLEVINPYIKEIHILLDENSDEKTEIETRIINLRRFLTQIILSYQKIYSDETFEQV